MSFVLAKFLAFALTGVQLAVVNATAPNDIVGPNAGITLGQGWYLRETTGGQSFRWVNNDAEFVVHRPAGATKKVAIEAEAGPGLGIVKFTLALFDKNNRQIAAVPVNGKQTVRFDLPVAPGGDSLFRLHVSGGGKRIPSDSRTLNFRVFSISDSSSDPNLAAGHPDIIASSANVRLGNNWYPLEEFKGETFRWVDNDAQFFVTSDKDQDRRLTLVTAPGPSIKSPAAFVIRLEDEAGRLIQQGTVKVDRSRGMVRLNLPLKKGQNQFRLNVDSTRAKAPNDPRVLDFRVFTLSVD